MRRPDWKHMSAEEWDYYKRQEADEKYKPEDPCQNKVKHIYIHNDGKDNTQVEILRARIDKAINKIMDLNILESDRKDLIKILTV